MTKKKYRSKPFRVAVEGATTDGRKIDRKWIEEMAAQYDPNTYGARINCEHIKWSWPGGEFGAYGDVTALSAQEVEIGGEKKLALYAQIEPNEALLALNKAGQKIYTSVEINPKFADTGKAYLVGLAITDSPASLGTEALAFSSQHGSLDQRKENKDNLFTATTDEEAVLDFEEVSETEPASAGLFKRVIELLGKNKDKATENDAQFTELASAVEALAEHAQQQDAANGKQQADFASRLERLESNLTELTTQLSTQPDPGQSIRPPATGGADVILTEF